MFKQLIETYKNTSFLHHGYLIIGERKVILLALAKTLQALGNDTTTVWENYETFGINESHRLVERSMRRNWNGQRELVVLTAKSYTPEAQNALLKLFEDPRAGLHFFLLGNKAADFLPTLQSRLVIIEHPSEAEVEEKPSEVQAQASEFLFAMPAGRLALIDRKVKSEMERDEWINFFNALEKIAHQSKPFPEKALTEINAVRPYFANPAFSARLIFEYLAFTLPIMVE
ncbi:MAG: hypothetical protein V1704_04025 [Candidatus Vogelbacteria bacterium]